MYKSHLDISEDAKVVYREHMKDLAKINKTWDHILPEKWFNAMMHNTVEHCYVRPTQNPSEVVPDSVIVVLPNDYYMKRFKDLYGLTTPEMVEEIDYVPFRGVVDHSFFRWHPKAKIAGVMTAGLFTHWYLKYE
eukprot:UN09879